MFKDVSIHYIHELIPLFSISKRAHFVNTKQSYTSPHCTAFNPDKKLEFLVSSKLSCTSPYCF